MASEGELDLLATFFLVWSCALQSLQLATAMRCNRSARWCGRLPSGASFEALELMHVVDMVVKLQNFGFRWRTTLTVMISLSNTGM